MNVFLRELDPSVVILCQEVLHAADKWGIPKLQSLDFLLLWRFTGKAICESKSWTPQNLSGSNRLQQVFRYWGLLLSFLEPLSQKGANYQKQPWLPSITSTQLYRTLLPWPASPQFWTCQWRFCETNYSQLRCQNLRSWSVSHSFASWMPRLSSALHHFSY